MTFLISRGGFHEHRVWGARRTGTSEKVQPRHYTSWRRGRQRMAEVGFSMIGVAKLVLGGVDGLIEWCF